MADMVADMMVDMEDDNVADMVLRRSLRWWSSMWVTLLERLKGVKDEVNQA